MVDLNSGGNPEESASGSDPLDLGIEAAFGLDPDADAPVARSVLRAFRGSAREPRIALGDPEPVVFPGELGTPGSELARYRLSGEIARGGVGSVLRARDLDLGREVAVKVLLEAHRGNAEMTRRFLEEAQIGGQLEHPGIVPVHEIGLLADERPYFAMKLVKGQTLAQLLSSRSDLVSMRQRFLAIFEQICQTMAYAHSRGVIHRDLKPSNVMVGTFGEVQIMDWGLAKVLPEGDEDGASPTRVSGEDASGPVTTARWGGEASMTGSVMGTPGYMPPEQARGEGELDERSDVFGLGAILCEILTGKPPHRGEGAGEILRKARGDAEDARHRLARSDADEELRQLTEDCLRFDRRERPRNALVVARRISDYLESVERRTQDLRVRAAKARLRLLVALLALVALVLGGGGYLWVEGERRARDDAARLAIGSALGRAKELRVRAASGDDPSLWDEALRESRLALQLSRESGQSVGAAEAEELRLELASEVRDRRTIRELESLREERDSDSEALEYRFRELFSRYGIDVEGEDVDIAAAKIRRSGISTELVLALDQWAVTHRFGPRPRARSELLAIAQKADDDPWRERLRRAVQLENHAQLRALASEAETRNLAPSTFEVLAFALRDRSKTRAVWFRAQQLHPGDFWINFRLGDFLLKEKETRDAIQYLRAAVALRPSSAYARYKLGTALAESASFREGFSQFAAAFRLESEARVGWFYHRCAEILRDHAEEVQGGDLDDLLGTLRNIREDRTRHHDGLELLLAEVWFLRGEGKKAIIVLEDTARNDNDAATSWRRRNSAASPLARYREAALPDLLTYASIDDALESVASGDMDPAILERFRRHNETRDDDDARARLLYYEARNLQRSGQSGKAISRFSGVLELDDGFPDPYMGLAECLRAIGDSERAEKTLRDALEARKLRHSDAWKLWARLVFVDLGATAESVLAVFPRVRPEHAGLERGARYGEDLGHNLEQLARGEAIRINCGGSEATDEGGRSWGRDRFYNSGNRRPPGHGGGPIHGTWRWFSSRNRGQSSDYEIPLPRGEYDLTLEITDPFERFKRSRGRTRSATLGIEGEDRQVAHGVSTLRVTVEDGFLDLRVPRRRRTPCLASIALERAD